MGFIYQKLFYQSRKVRNIRGVIIRSKADLSKLLLEKKNFQPEITSRENKDKNLSGNRRIGEKF